MFAKSPPQICPMQCHLNFLYCSPVHVVLVSLLVDQLSSLFLPFYGRPKKNCSVSGNFWSGSDFFLVDQISVWYTKISFQYTKKSEPDQKNSETDQKYPETEQIFFWSTKKSEKQTGQLVDQETDQTHMDGTIIICFLNFQNFIIKKLNFVSF